MVADWFLNLPVSWMALIVFLATFLIAGGVYLVVTRLAEKSRAFKAVSPGLLPVTGRSFRAVGWLYRGRGLEQFR
jgi:hypothetical protein